jgi:hypothetical protein
MEYSYNNLYFLLIIETLYNRIANNKVILKCTAKLNELNVKFNTLSIFLNLIS